MMHVNNLGQQRAYAAAQRREMERSGRHAQLGETIPVPGLPNAESQIAIPLLIRDDLIGVFSIESPVSRSFGEHERDLVSIVANQIASAIHNARLYEQRRLAAAALQEANVSLEARVAERTAALERELRVAQALLNEARIASRGPCSATAPSSGRCAMPSHVRPRSTEPLLLTGPAGSGKEAVARAVHDASGRTGAFIFVSCAEVNTQYRHAAEAMRSRNPDSVSHREPDLNLRRAGRCFSMRCTSCRQTFSTLFIGTLERDRSRPPRGESGVPTCG